MKHLRPSLLIFFGSFLLTILVFILAFVCRYIFPKYVSLSILVFSVIIGTIAYLIFYFSLKVFIQSRLQKIYKSIQRSPITNHKNIDGLVEEAETYVNEFHDTRTQEISKLKIQEEFRKEFIGNLSHELKTPIFSIQGYIDSLLDGGIDNPEINRRFLERAAKSTERMVQLVDDLDQITRLEETHLQIEKRPFDLIELIKEVIDNLVFQAKEKNITILLKKPYPSTFVLGDRNKITQVFINLIHNSISYGNQDGTTTISIITNGDIVNVEVADNGLGIDPKHWIRIFERFYRVEKSRNRNEGGTGLGLSIVKHILEAHGQTISFTSTVGIGSVFYFGLEKSSKNLQLSSRGVPLT